MEYCFERQLLPSPAFPPWASRPDVRLRRYNKHLWKIEQLPKGWYLERDRNDPMKHHFSLRDENGKEIAWYGIIGRYFHSK